MFSRFVIFRAPPLRRHDVALAQILQECPEVVPSINRLDKKFLGDDGNMGKRSWDAVGDTLLETKIGVHHKDLVTWENRDPKD